MQVNPGAHGREVTGPRASAALIFARRHKMMPLYTFSTLPHWAWLPMRLTTLTDYALRLLMHVAQQPERLCTITEIAERYGISEPHLMKVTHRLALAGWLETVRGRGGGMRLAKPADQIPLGAVVRDMESDFQIVECFGSNGQCALDGHCQLANAIGDALEAFLSHLDGLTLQDVLPSPRRLARRAAKASSTVVPLTRQPRAGS